MANHGFTGNDDQLLTQVADLTRGFALALAGLKGVLELNLRLNLVADRYPRGIEHREFTSIARECEARLGYLMLLPRAKLGTKH